MRSADGHVTFLLVGLASSDIEAQQRAVVAVRGAVAPLRTELLHLDPTAQVAVTGGPAADFDVNDWSAKGGDRAEKHALPLTIIILLMAFGDLVAASLPFLMGLATTTVALGSAFILAKIVPVSNLLSNVVTMIGLAIGIDYSLLMVTRFREQAVRERLPNGRRCRRASRTDHCVVGRDRDDRVLRLLFSPILETRCAGIGGALVVCISVLAALTLLPATLVLLGPYIERWSRIPRRMRLGTRPKLLAQAPRVDHSTSACSTLVISGACLLALALPLLKAQHGVSNERWFLPRATEARAGAEILAALRSDNSSLGIYAIVRATDGLPLLAPEHIKPLVDYADRLEHDPQIATVMSPVTLQKGFGAAEYSALYHNVDEALRGNPTIAELYPESRSCGCFVRDHPGRCSLGVRQIEQLTRDLAKIAPPGPFTVMIGGTPAARNDFSDYMFKSLPWIFGFVIGATLLMLFIAFRSYLLPIEAVLMNLLAVAAGNGAVVAVFQLGWLNGLIGLERPFAAIPLEVPMMVFCLSFGLSMDYELFLLFRIQREYMIDRTMTAPRSRGWSRLRR